MSALAILRDTQPDDWKAGGWLIVFVFASAVLAWLVDAGVMTP